MNNNKVQAIVEKVKELVQRGNVSRIVVRKGERVPVSYTHLTLPTTSRV